MISGKSLKGVSVENGIMVVSAILVGFIVIAVVLNTIDPTKSVSVEMDNILIKGSSYINSLSTVNEGVAELKFDRNYNISVVYDKTHQSHFMVVGNSVLKEKSRRIKMLSYPNDNEDRNLLRSMEDVKMICISKETGTVFAVIDRC